MKYNLLNLFQTKVPSEKNGGSRSPWSDRKVLAYFLSFQEIEKLTRSTRRDNKQSLFRSERLTLGSELFSPMAKSY